MSGRLAGSDAPAEDGATVDEVIVLHAVLDPQPRHGAPPPLLERLPYAKRLELEAREPAARHAGLCGIELALRGAARLRGGDAIIADLCFPTDGKPYLRGGPVFSISHTVRRVAVALAAGGELGLDLEDAETDRAASSAVQTRLARWTATEAVLKAAGRGLREARGVELDAAAGTATFAGRTYVLKPLAIAPDLIAHLAADRMPASIAIESVDLDA